MRRALMTRATAVAVAAGTVLAVGGAAIAQPPEMTTGTGTFYVDHHIGSLKVETNSSTGTVQYSVDGVSVFAGIVDAYVQSDDGGVDVAEITGSITGGDGGTFSVTIADNAAGGSTAPPDQVTVVINGVTQVAGSYVLDGNFTVH